MMVQATMAVYKSAVAHFLPTPSKSHYVFNLRDFSRVVRGVLLVPKTHLAEGDKLMRLWVHEVYRVFYDRLIDDQDRCLYNSVFMHGMGVSFCMGLFYFTAPNLTVESPSQKESNGASFSFIAPYSEELWIGMKIKFFSLNFQSPVLWYSEGDAQRDV